MSSKFNLLGQFCKFFEVVFSWLYFTYINSSKTTGLFYHPFRHLLTLKLKLT
jgi:hypothetical protein